MRHASKRRSELQQTDAPHPAGSIIKELILALRQHKAWGPCEHLALALAEAVEEYEELSLPYRVAYEILEATQGDSWLDTELAVAFLEDVAAQLHNAAPAEDLPVRQRQHHDLVARDPQMASTWAGPPPHSRASSWRRGC